MSLLTLTGVPPDFGSGGANLSPNGSSGTPSLYDLLNEHKEALETLDTAIGEGGGTGPTGPTGATGATGAAGAVGRPGFNGEDGEDGTVFPPCMAAPPVVFASYARVYQHEDFLPSFDDSNTPFVGEFTSGGGALTYLASEAGHPGIARLSATSTGAAMFLSTLTSYGQHGGGIVENRIGFRVPVLSNGTDRFQLVLGFSDFVPGSDNREIQIRYIDNVNSGKFQYVTKSAGGVETLVDSGLTAVAGAWYNLLISPNASATAVTFSINGGNIQTISTTIPTGEMGVNMVCTHSAGAGGAIDIDYWTYDQILTTPRR